MDIVRNQADELVREARLKAIEREHRSKGSILDTRELYKIVDPPLYDESIRRRKNGNKAAVVAAAAAASSSVESPDKDVLKDKRVGFSFQVEGDFKMEEQLWRTKSTDAESIQKRRYENAELHKFRESLTVDQKAIFREKVVQRVRDLSSRYRDEMTELKRDLDRAGMFHPAANAHRVHCMYLMKLHKGFTVETIEVPILRSLKAEELTKARHDAYEEEKRARLIKLATEGKSADTDFTAKPVDTSPVVEGTQYMKPILSLLYLISLI
jgi:hypothetical protein